MVRVMSEGSQEITLRPGNVWRVGLVVLAVIALGLMLQFIIRDGGSVIFTVLMAWFAAIAMALPAFAMAATVACRLPRSILAVRYCTASEAARWLHQ